MKKYILGIAVFICFLTGGCNIPKEDKFMFEVGSSILERGIAQLGRHVDDSKDRINEIKADIVRLKKEAYIRKAEKSPIVYSPWLDGVWQSIDVKYASSPFSKGHEIADSLVGKTYDFSIPWKTEVIGGSVPIRDDKQLFFWIDYPYYLSELGIEGDYYTIVRFSEKSSLFFDEHPCCIIKNKNEILITELCTGVYTAVRVDHEEVRENVYDPMVTFEENIKNRIELQGINHMYYYGMLGVGHWVIEEVIYAENFKEAEKHLGKIVEYSLIDKFDLEFFDSPQSKIFYDMPSVEELGISGEYYLITWVENNEYPAAIVKSEQELFFIKGNLVLRASRIEDGSEWTILYAG